MCNFKFAFSLHAGPTDILMVRLQQVENLTIRYFIGTSYRDVQGKTLDNAGGKQIRVTYPFNLYIIAQQSSQGEASQIGIEYDYLDQDSRDPLETVDGMFDIQEIKTSK